MVEDQEYFVGIFEPLHSSLKKGSTGGSVKKLQEALNIFGAGLAVDGIFGPLTDGAVRSFQKVHGLEIDGIVGQNTWAALDGYKMDDGKISGFVRTIAEMFSSSEA